jgi:hypothetical protein
MMEIKLEITDQNGVDDCNLQARSASTDIRVTPTCASTHHGESQRVLIIAFVDDSRDKWLCHRYVLRCDLGCDGNTRTHNFESSHQILACDF